MRFVSFILPALAVAEIHTIAVGKSGLTFEPQTITAKTHDFVVFELYPDHDVISGGFGSPCTPNNNFYSGPYGGTDGGKKRFVINVTNEDAVYFYCGTDKHCQGGMVGGINLPTNGDTVQAYAAAAKGVSESRTPDREMGGLLLEEGKIGDLTASSAMPSATGSASGSASSRAASVTTAAASSSPTSTGAAAGTVPSGQIGAVTALVMSVVAWFL